MKEKIYKLFLTLLVCLSIGSSPIEYNEISKMLKSLSEATESQIEGLDENEAESGEDYKIP